jgi:hypothetical protein
VREAMRGPCTRSGMRACADGGVWLVRRTTQTAQVLRSCAGRDERFNVKNPYSRVHGAGVVTVGTLGLPSAMFSLASTTRGLRGRRVRAGMRSAVRAGRSGLTGRPS